MRSVFLFLSIILAATASAGINSFTATPQTFLPGQEVTLSWNVTAGDVIAISPGVGVVSGATGSVTVIPDGTTTYTLSDSTSTTSAQVVATQIGAPQLTNRWSFNEGTGTAVTDSVGGKNGTIIGASWSRSATQVSLPGGGSGSAPYIDLPNGLLSSKNEITIEGWVTINSSQNWSRIFDFGTTGSEINNVGGSGSGLEYLFLSAQIGSDQAQKRIEVKENGVTQLVSFGDQTTNLQQFHFAVVYDADGNNGAPQLHYYKNGTYIGTLNTTIRLQNISDVNNWLGRSNYVADANLSGAFNEFRIWNGPLSATAIADNVSSGPDALPAVPRVDSFTALPSTTIFEGSSVRLSYLLTGPSAGGTLTASVDQGIGTLSGTSGYVTVSPKTTTTYTLTASNNAGTRTAQVTIFVLPSAPVAETLSVRVPYNGTSAVTLIASDPNTATGSLTYSIVTGPMHGSLSGAGANLTYTPTPGYSGPDSFAYKANDGSLDSNIATVSIVVNPAPVAPVDLAISDSAIFTDYSSGSFVGRLSAADGNPDDRFTFTLVNGVGSTHNAYFTISGNQLIAARDFSGDLGQTISLRLRVTDSNGLSFEKVITLPVQSRSRNVQINEIHYNPSRNTLRSEYIELYNPLATSVDLSGWRLTEAVDFVFPSGTSVPAGGYLVVAQDPITIGNLYGVAAVGPWTKNLSSEGDDVRLLNASGVTVDRVEYGVTAPWPALPNGEGPSLELINPAFNRDLGGNWKASTVAPTAVNYVTAGTQWSYRKGTSEASTPIGAWRAVSFSQDGTWLSGTAPIGVFKQNSNTAVSSLPEFGVTLGTQLADMATYSGSSFVTNYRSVFFRKTFNVTGTIPRALLLRVMHHDAAVVWINGIEVARFGFPQNSPSDLPYNYTAYYERGNDPWSELVLVNPSAYLTAGTNVIAIQGFAKPPAPRATDSGSTGQEDLSTYNIFDFCVDAELKNVPELTGTPGAQNSVFSTTNAPAVRNIECVPQQAKAWQPVTIKARISDPQGVGAVSLSYQINAPGNYIPATLPLSNSAILANPFQPLPANPAFENAANWISIPMVDDGSVAGDTAGDGVFTAVVPAQPHRTLVRYRINAEDLTGLKVRVPATDDPRRNFAYFVYNGTPVYSAGGQSFGPGVLDTLPVYHWLTRSSDYSSMLAYNGSEQFSNSIDIKALLARRYENFSGTLVVGGQVIDHTLVRLRGGNSRYNGSGKRHLHFKFPKGTPFYAGDEIGTPYRVPWEDMLFNKMFGNKGNYDWGLPYEVGAKLWALQGVPTPESHWVHFRVVQNANENHVTLGDFWGLYHALEYPDGKNFLNARDLPKGNFYKMSDWIQNGEMDERYQVNGAVDFAEDFDNIRFNVHQTASETFLKTYVNMPLWYRYNAMQEALRHYDIFVEPTGRHRVKNLIWWFEPQSNNPLGRCLFMPYDWDASFGPTFNSGWDFVHNALYNHADVTDSPTWQLPKQNRTSLQIEHRNAIRELRDLLWYRDTSGRGPFDDIVDDALGRIAAFWRADFARWPNPGALANNVGGAPWKAQDMKNFAFTGWSDTVGSDPAVGAGGRADYLDDISEAVDLAFLPSTPTISYGGAGGFPVDGIALTSSAFSDPQGANTFAAMQWRIGEITDRNAPSYNPAAPRLYEVTSVWESGELTTFSSSVTVPGTVLRTGHTYRARVRHKDSSGRWSHWSSPVQFTATASNYAQTLAENLMVSELMYRPAAPTDGYLEGDFEYIELVNISSSLTLDLSNVRFTKGIDFNFAGSAITSLAPGARVLVVKNAAAFAQRYGAGKPIAGEWDAADNLSNSGEQLKLSYGAGAAIQDFTYSDSSPWPKEADAGGYSLVLKAPETRPNHNLGTNWRASYALNGTPGTDDRRKLSDWATTNNVTDFAADDDKDGIVNLLEYALRGAPKIQDQSVLPVQSVRAVTVGGITSDYLTISFRRFPGAEDIAYVPEWSTDLVAWTADGELIGSTDNGDGSVTQVWRAPQPVSAGKHFGRLKVMQR